MVDVQRRTPLFEDEQRSPEAVPLPAHHLYYGPRILTPEASSVPTTENYLVRRLA